MKVLEILANGKTTEKNLERVDLANEFQIHFRDFRPVFSGSQVATILPRKNCIIVNFGIVKAVMASQKIYLFNPQNTTINQEFIPWILKHFQGQKKGTRFELLALEKSLAFKVQRLKKEEKEIENKVTTLLQKLQKNIDDERLEELLHLKKQLSGFDIRARENEAAILEILKEDETIAELCLQGEAPKNLDEPESILESALEQLEDMIHHISAHKEHIDDTQEIANLKLSNRRNTIIQINLWVTTLTVILAILTVITGIFGMNIRNNLEESFSAFFWLLTGMGGITLVTLLGVIWYFQKKKVL